MCENEPDSEDDYEGYFLKPVNEYNIVDRIKNANEELFASPKPPSPSVLSRKVKFREVLEDYEPHEVEEDEFGVKEADNIPDHCDDIDTKPIPSSPTSSRSEKNVCPENNMSDSSDPEIEEICEDIDSLEVQDPNSDCERSIATDQTDDNPEISISVSVGLPDGSASKIASTSQRDTVQQTVSNASPSKANRDRSPCEQKPKTKSCTQYGGDILKLRLNYKTCCEYKNSMDNLPRYSGYFSQYGLSKEQWERREKRYEKNRKRFFERSIKTTENQNKKMEDNERAFTNWLRSKMRFPLNKTKNMFDFKPNKLKRRKKPSE